MSGYAAAAGGVLGMIQGVLNNQMTRSNQIPMGITQIQLNDLQAQQNQKYQMELWEKTGPLGMVEQLNKSGLNPALMYGMGGAGGQTANASSGGVHNQIPEGKMDIIGGIGMGLQLELLKAQKENIEADTKDKLANIPVKGAQKPNIEADTKNKGLAYSKLEAEIQNIAQDTMKKVNEVEQLRINNKINGQSAEDQIKTIKYEAIGAMLKNSLTSAQTNNTKQDTLVKREQIPLIQRQLVNMVQENMREWDKMNFQERIIRVQEKLAEWNTDVDKFTVEQITKMISIGTFTDILNPQQTHTPIQGFKR